MPASERAFRAELARPDRDRAGAGERRVGRFRDPRIDSLSVISLLFCKKFLGSSCGSEQLREIELSDLYGGGHEASAEGGGSPAARVRVLGDEAMAVESMKDPGNLGILPFARALLRGEMLRMLEPRSQVVVGEAARGLRHLGSLLMRYASHLVFLLAKYPATEIEDRRAPRASACGRVSTPACQVAPSQITTAPAFISISIASVFLCFRAQFLIRSLYAADSDVMSGFSTVSGDSSHR